MTSIATLERPPIPPEDLNRLDVCSLRPYRNYECTYTVYFIFILCRRDFFLGALPADMYGGWLSITMRTRATANTILTPLNLNLTDIKILSVSQTMVCNWHTLLQTPLRLSLTQSIEMSQFNQPASNPNAILDHCRDIDQGINSVESYISQINNLYRRLLSDVDPARENAIRAEAEELADETKNLYRNLIERMKSIKKDQDAGNPRNTPHISRVERRLKAAITSYQQVQVDFRKESETQMARQYRIVRPDATDEEVREAVQDSSNQQIFSQAVCLQLRHPF